MPPPPAAAESIRKRAFDHWKRSRGNGDPLHAVHLSPEERERLRALGYVLP